MPFLFDKPLRQLCAGPTPSRRSIGDPVSSGPWNLPPHQASSAAVRAVTHMLTLAAIPHLARMTSLCRASYLSTILNLLPGPPCLHPPPKVRVSREGSPPPSVRSPCAILLPPQLPPRPRPRAHHCQIYFLAQASPLTFRA